MKVVILPNDEKSPSENIKSTMTEIGGLAVLLHTVMLFEKYGFYEFVICDNSSGHEIRDYINSHYSFVRGTKIRILKIPQFLKGTKILSICQKNGVENAFFVAPNDVITDLNVEKMLSFHRQSARVATICVAEEKKYFGALGNISEEKYESKIVNSGFYIFESEATDYMEGNVSLDTEPVINMVENDELSVYSDAHFVQRCR